MDRGSIVLGLNSSLIKESYFEKEAAEDENTSQNESANVALGREDSDRIKKLKKNMIAEIEAHYKGKYEDLLDGLERRNKELKLKTEKLESLVIQFEGKYLELVDTRMSTLEIEIVELVLQSIYKILGEKSINEKYAEQVVRRLLEAKSKRVELKLCVSSENYETLKELLSGNKEAEALLVLDGKLKPGQMLLVDKAIVKEVGLLDRIETLKTAFMDELRNNSVGHS